MSLLHSRDRLSRDNSSPDDGANWAKKGKQVEHSEVQSKD